MPRMPRIEFAGAIYHVVDGGNGGQDIFRSDEDRTLFLHTLEDVCTQTGWIVHSYVLMSNHYHIQLETPQPNLKDGMRWFQQTYTQRFNRRNQLSGHLYQGRYKSPVVQGDAQSDYFRELGTYIHLNPFRAHMAGWPGLPHLPSYRWSSYPYYIGRRKKVPKWLQLRRMYSHCGWSLRHPNAGRLYRELVNARMAYERDPRNEKAAEDAYRQMRRGWFIGGDEFRDHLVSLFPEKGSIEQLRGEQRFDHSSARAETLISRALEALELDEDTLLATKSTDPRKGGVAWLVKSHTTMTGAWLANRLNMGHRVNASRAISKFRQQSSKEVKNIKKIMLQCTS